MTVPSNPGTPMSTTSPAQTTAKSPASTASPSPSDQNQRPYRGQASATAKTAEAATKRSTRSESVTVDRLDSRSTAQV